MPMMQYEAKPLAAIAVAAASRPIPVILLTGFLGSGKTTLLNRVLSDARLAASGIIVNEFGSVDVDGDIVRIGHRLAVTSTTGCICCSAGSDVTASLETLLAAGIRSGLPAIDRVIIETTGLADPAPIINALLQHGIAGDLVRFELANVITTFDVEFGRNALDRHMEAWKQIAFADDVILTKGDLSPGSIAGAREQIEALNPLARIHDSRSDVDPVLPFVTDRTYATEGKADDVAGWLALERFSHHGDHAHAPDRHGNVSTLRLSSKQPIDRAKLDTFLNIVTTQANSGLLRLKGIAMLADDVSRPLVVHAVRHRRHPDQRLESWPAQDGESRIVLIGENMPASRVKDLFEAAIRPRRSWWRKR